MTINKALFSSKTDEWATPQGLFDEWNEAYQFELDVCATAENAKCKDFFTKEQNGLAQDWYGKRCWMNPPYGKDIGLWLDKASKTARPVWPVVCLLPARTDVKWFHQYCYNKPNVEIHFLKGRLKFGGSKNSAPFPSMIAVFR